MKDKIIEHVDLIKFHKHYLYGSDIKNGCMKITDTTNYNNTNLNTEGLKQRNNLVIH